MTSHDDLIARLIAAADEEKRHAIEQDFWHEDLLREAAEALRGKAETERAIPSKARELPKLTEDMMRAACKAHYETDNIDGVSMTYRGVDYTFRSAFKRMWAGIRKQGDAPLKESEGEPTPLSLEERVAAAEARAERAEKALFTMIERSLSVDMVIDALGCYWNAAISAAHERQESGAFSTASITATGIAAVAERLRELSSEKR